MSQNPDLYIQNYLFPTLKVHSTYWIPCFGYSSSKPGNTLFCPPFRLEPVIWSTSWATRGLLSGAPSVSRGLAGGWICVMAKCDITHRHDQRSSPPHCARAAIANNKFEPRPAGRRRGYAAFYVRLAFSHTSTLCEDLPAVTRGVCAYPEKGTRTPRVVW